MLGCVRLSDNLRGILGKWGRGKYKKRRPTFDRYPIVVYHHSKISQLYQGMKKRNRKLQTHTQTDGQSRKLRIIDLLTAQWKQHSKILFNNGWIISSSAAIFITELHVVFLHQSQCLVFNVHSQGFLNTKLIQSSVQEPLCTV